MSKPFEPFTINRMQIKNRFVRSATMDNMGSDSMVTEAQLELYRDLSLGEVGLIISSGIFPSINGQAGKGQLGAHTDETIPSLKKIADMVHKNNGKVAAQLLHGGWQCNPELTGQQPIGPSALIHPFRGIPIKGLSIDEVYEEIERFVQAGRRLIEAGFDAIQFHGAHSWLISAFLSPVTNKREDEFGGSAKKRANFVIQIYKGIRRIAGPDYPVFIKLGLKDYHSQGKSLDEGLKTAAIFEEIGMDAIEISEGVEEERSHHIRLGALFPYYLDECRQARRVLKQPIILVGGMRQLKDVEQVLEEDIADAVSMCRPFVMDRYIVKKFHQGVATSSACTSCNGCTGLNRTTLRCVLPD
ncbi:MAG: NADH:flavin oxidoreductase [Dehalococcoidales bacterium]|nr:NADH:flavin oxidoreductase [Dehalococcoidales bacterium]